MHPIIFPCTVITTLGHNKYSLPMTLIVYKSTFIVQIIVTVVVFLTFSPLLASFPTALIDVYALPFVYYFAQLSKSIQLPIFEVALVVVPLFVRESKHINSLPHWFVAVHLPVVVVPVVVLAVGVADLLQVVQILLQNGLLAEY